MPQLSWLFYFILDNISSLILIPLWWRWRWRVRICLLKWILRLIHWSWKLISYLECSINIPKLLKWSLSIKIWSLKRNKIGGLKIIRVSKIKLLIHGCILIHFNNFIVLVDLILTLSVLELIFVTRFNQILHLFLQKFNFIILLTLKYFIFS